MTWQALESRRRGRRGAITEGASSGFIFHLITKSLDVCLGAFHVFQCLSCSVAPRQMGPGGPLRAAQSGVNGVTIKVKWEVHSAVFSQPTQGFRSVDGRCHVKSEVTRGGRGVACQCRVKAKMKRVQVQSDFVAGFGKRCKHCFVLGFYVPIMHITRWDLYFERHLLVFFHNFYCALQPWSTRWDVTLIHCVYITCQVKWLDKVSWTKHLPK